MSLVWIRQPRMYRPWCVLRYADPAGTVATLCLDGAQVQPYGVLLCTTDPGDDACPACRRELAAGTPGVAVAVTTQRVTTRDLRPPVEVELEEWGP